MNKKLYFLISFSFFTLLGFFVFTKTASAAEFYLSPATGSVEINKNITLDVRVNTQGVQTAIADMQLIYDPTKLEFQSYSNSGSPLLTAIGLSAGSGSVSITQYIPGSGNTPPTPTQGDILYGKVTFKALVGTGSSTVSFGSSSVVYDFATGSPVGSTTGTSGTYTFTTPATPPPSEPPPATTPPTTTTPSSGSTSTSSPSSGSSTSTNTTNSDGAEMVNIPNSVGDTQAPTISKIEVSELTDTSVTIIWTTNESSTSYVDYGETTNYGLGNGDASYTKDHKVVIIGLQAATKYNFRVFSSDQAGNTAYGKNQDFTTKPSVSVQRTYRFIGLSMIIGGIAALAIIAFIYFRKKGPHPDNLELPDDPKVPLPNLNPPI